MKSFDLFRKNTMDHSSSPTIIGALLSIVAIFLMFYVLFKELNEYLFVPNITRESIIFQDKNQQETVKVNLGITFHNLPCSLVSVDQEDMIGHHRLNIENTINKLPIDSQGNPNQNKINAHETEKLLIAIKNQEGCFVEGVVPISKVAGDIHISSHAYRDVFTYLQNTRNHFNITASHRFSLLNFGEQQISRKILDRFHMNDQETNFNRVIDLPNHTDTTWEFDFDYYIKLVPQVFIDEVNNEELIAYQYSLTSKSKKRNHPLGQPVIMISYDFSPVAVKYIMKKRYLSHLLTNICALVGGVFVIFNIVNGIINRLGESLEVGDKARASIN